MSIGANSYVYLTDVIPPIGLSLSATIEWILSCIIGFYGLNIICIMGEFYTFLTCLIIGFIGSFIFAGYSIETEELNEKKIIMNFKSKEFF